MERKQDIGKTVDLNFYGVKNWEKGAYEYKWTSSDESIAVVDKNGRVTMVGVGIAIIRLEMTEKSTGNKMNIAPVEVGVPDEIYEVFLGTSKKETGLRHELLPGQKLDFNFYGIKNYKAKDYTYRWTSSDETVALVDKKGIVTALAPGKTVIRLEMERKATGEKLLIAPVVLSVPEWTEDKRPDEKE